MHMPPPPRVSSHETAPLLRAEPERRRRSRRSRRTRSAPRAPPSHVPPSAPVSPAAAAPAPLLINAHAERHPQDPSAQLGEIGVAALPARAPAAEPAHVDL
ncbi:unnamed protein product [Euphydryas editha]|uniref:Uncharacterized protein n=1 Tax=Euphydryas editha TaxID=104508 RepID=A0AAU9UNM9_EUPED|nr:unnamed protein product [Euphydryas editha]